MRTIVSVEQFRKEARSKRNPTSPVFRVSLGSPEDAGYRTKRFCFSDGSIDRMGDTIDPAGWDLSDFNRNPVILWCHDSSAPPIGRARNVGLVGKRLMGDIEFAGPDVYDFAETIFRLVDGQFLNAVSVGFLPLKFSYVQNNPARPGGIDFRSQILLEVSCCGLPANPNALSEARAKGIDTRPLSRWAERTLDAGGNPMFGRGGLVRLREAGREPVRTGIANSRAADLATAAAIADRVMSKTPWDRRAADLVRAAAVRRKICGRRDAIQGFEAMGVELRQQEELRRRDRAAAADRLGSIHW